MNRSEVTVVEITKAGQVCETQDGGTIVLAWGQGAVAGAVRGTVLQVVKDHPRGWWYAPGHAVADAPMPEAKVAAKAAPQGTPDDKAPGGTETVKGTATADDKVPAPQDPAPTGKRGKRPAAEPQT